MKIPRGHGQTRWCFKVVTTKCVCDKSNTKRRNKWFIGQVDLEVALLITLDTYDKTPHTRDGVYGHERRHVKMMGKALNKKRKEVEAILKAAENHGFISWRNCKDARASLKLKKKTLCQNEQHCPRNWYSGRWIPSCPSSRPK